MLQAGINALREHRHLLEVGPDFCDDLVLDVYYMAMYKAATIRLLLKEAAKAQPFAPSATD
jgi:hypothetical protein